MEDCIFCKMASSEVPVAFVYEDADVVAFDDLHPQAPVHVLIVPRSHHTGPGDGVSADLAAALMAAVPKVAALTGSPTPDTARSSTAVPTRVSWSPISTSTCWVGRR